jgi:hypothetical protein
MPSDGIHAQYYLNVLLPAAALSLALHVWAVMSPVAVVNADEAMTGLQAYNVLQGHVALVVEGNGYGGALESYLTTPILLVTSGTVALKAVPVFLSFVFGFAMAWASTPLLGRRVAVIACAVTWISSGASVSLWSHNYLGYASGAIALVMSLGCAVRAVRTWSPAVVFGAGFSAGFALWGHPVFGLLAGLGCLSILVRRRGLLYAGLGAVTGALPWLIYLGGHEFPPVPVLVRSTTYLERVQILVTELLPSGFGLRTVSGHWVEPFFLTAAAAALLIVVALAGLVMLPRWAGPEALPFTISGIGAFPVLAIFQAMSFSTDGRYSVAFLPMLLVGLFGWSRAGSATAQPRLRVAAAIPLVWGFLACVPSLHATSGWVWENPNRDAEDAVVQLRERGVTAVRGDYWAVYLLDYYGQGQLDSLPDSAPRLLEDAARARATPAAHVAFVYEAGSVEAGAVTLPGPSADYQSIPAGRWEIWLPAAP